ncbi:hypothetical protein HWV62_7232 [Athelia sp. TMB]|nr:hypothetical protein HWV62_7232 [Athelia sp. TMB]
MATIPHFDLHRVTVRPRCDGRFGELDFTLAPQVYSPRYAHRVLIASNTGPERPHDACMKWTPSRSDFVAIKGCLFSDLGRLRAPQLQEMDDLSMHVKYRAYAIMGSRDSGEHRDLEHAVTHLRHGITRLRYNPYTYRELIMDVAQTQRFYFDVLSQCEYIEQDWPSIFSQLGPVSGATRCDKMGAWTTDPVTVQMLHQAGLPVYFVRPSSSLHRSDRVLHVQTVAARNTNILTEDWSENGQLRPFPDRYVGPPSDELHAALSASNCYRDLESYFIAFDNASMLVPVGVQASRPRATRMNVEHVTGITSGSGRDLPKARIPARDKWMDMKSQLIPSTLAPWSAALGRIDRSKRLPAAPPKALTGYRFPDPGMLVYSDNRRERNLFNWLAVREANIRKASNDAASGVGVPVGLSNELWRLYLGTDYLNGVSPSVTRSAMSSQGPHKDISSRRRVLMDIFGRPPDIQHIREVDWDGHAVQWGTFQQHDALLVQEVMWDLHQWSFQYDLIAIDRYLAPEAWSHGIASRYRILDDIFGGHSVLSVATRPRKDFGLASSDTRERRAAYSALKCIMEGWGSSVSMSLDVSDEETLATAYCQSFATTMGRPPIMPKHIPKPSDSSGMYAYRRSG